MPKNQHHFSGNEVATNHSDTFCLYHSTKVVEKVKEGLIIRHGGYPTATTVRRINQWADCYNHHVRVCRKNGEVVTNCGKVVTTDGIFV